MDKLYVVLDSLPQMSKDIVDDTIHEKVLSYLSEYASQGPDMIATFMERNVMKIIRACIIQENGCNEIETGHECIKDSRITSLAIRFLARLLANDDRQRALLFNQIIYDYNDALDFILDNAFSEEGLMRYSCIEALEQIVTYELGAKWFHNTKGAQVVVACFLDSSTYVASAASRLLLSIINHSTFINTTKTTAQNDLLEFLISTLDLFNKIQEMLFNPRKDIGQRLSALQFILTLASSKTTNSFEFLKRGQLLTRIDVLLAERDRVMRSRVNDILCAVFEWASDPISLLKGASYTNDPIIETFDFVITDIVFLLLHNDTSFDMVVVSVNVLESLILLVKRASNDQEKLASRIMDILIFLLSFFKIRQQAEKSINKLSVYDNPDVNSLYTNGTYDKITASTDAICDILFVPNYVADHRILKAVLSVIPIVLSAKITNSLIKEKQTINEILETIQKLMKDTQTECQSIAILLETMQKLLADNTTGQYILDNKYGDEWADVLLCKVHDFRWEIRDSILEFADKLFDESNNTGVGVNFALRFGLPQMVVSKISDDTAYVRASCLKAIKSIVRCSDGWNYIVSHSLHIQIASKLPLMMKDTEALVRRAVMELMICLIIERGCGAILLTNQNVENINQAVMDKIMNDPDFYVQIGGCQFLTAIWYHCEQNKNNELDETSLIGENSSWFYWLNGDKFLIDAADNPSRLVRGEILQILRRLKVYLEEHITSNKESSINDNSQLNNEAVSASERWSIGQLSPLMQKHSDFYRKMCLIDFDRLEATIDVEHLYKEALESINPRMMVNADLIVEGNEDNTLDCYF
ncbi:42262_t:CDS:10 [Gigaspora margarita]|uniref:42262_t:CDS:1 n=1 Tax=Gigaspora margarita TaxID=4874 RepID=A0ABN7W5N5_GIGMA|nr:42262_t:CDS:10 [Gigaspora margarita]